MNPNIYVVVVSNRRDVSLNYMLITVVSSTAGSFMNLLDALENVRWQPVV
jgi:hypothetical protein